MTAQQTPLWQLLLVGLGAGAAAVGTLLLLKLLVFGGSTDFGDSGLAYWRFRLKNQTGGGVAFTESKFRLLSTATSPTMTYPRQIVGTNDQFIPLGALADGQSGVFPASFGDEPTPVADIRVVHLSVSQGGNTRVWTISPDVDGDGNPETLAFVDATVTAVTNAPNTSRADIDVYYYKGTGRTPVLTRVQLAQQQASS